MPQTFEYPDFPLSVPRPTAVVATIPIHNKVVLRCNENDCWRSFGYTTNVFCQEDGGEYDGRYWPMCDVVLMEDAVKLDIPEHDNPFGHRLRMYEVEKAWEGHGRQIAGVQLLKCRNCDNIVGIWTTKYGGRGGVATMLCFDNQDTYLSSDQSPENVDYNVVPLTMENVSEAARYYFDLASPPPDANEQTEIEAEHRGVYHDEPTNPVVRDMLMGIRPPRRARRPRESQPNGVRRAEPIDLTLSDGE